VLRLSRRSFVTWLSALTATFGFAGRAASAESARSDGRRGETARRLRPASSPAPPLDEAMVVALAAAVLPSELGTDGASAAARRFTQWLAGYRAGAEVLHPYGSPTIERLPPSPATTWHRQLTALDAAARRVHGTGFISLGIGLRQALVRDALAGMKLAGMPAPLSAPHVSVALLSHFHRSAEGTDLCYRAQIRKGQCRPLATSSRQPLPLAGGGST
jgi:hypothetical protein